MIQAMDKTINFSTNMNLTITTSSHKTEKDGLRTRDLGVRGDESL